MRWNAERFFKQMVTDPNSSSGLIIRAEVMEENAEKQDGEERESSLIYARVLRELASKNWSIEENRKWIKDNLRPWLK